MKISPFKSLYPNVELLVSPDSFFETMAKDFAKHYESGLFHECEIPAVFIYQNDYGDKTHTGIITNTAITDLLEGKILYHEDTIATKEQDMVLSSLEIKAMIKPVMLFYSAVDDINKFIQKFIGNNEIFYSCTTNDGLVHRLWKVSETSDLNYIELLFEQEVKKAYIADGHHRCSTTRRLYESKSKQFSQLDFSSLMTVYFAEDQLEIYDHIKVVNILEEMKPEIFITRLAKYADIRHMPKFQLPGRKNEFVILMNQETFKARWKKRILNKYIKKEEALDPIIMNQIVFQKIFERPDVRKDKRISFFSGNKSAKAIEQFCFAQKNAISICQFPIQLSDIVLIANQKKTMPPKSTWIEPKTKSGVIAQKY